MKNAVYKCQNCGKEYATPQEVVYIIEPSTAFKGGVGKLTCPICGGDTPIRPTQPVQSDLQTN